MAAKTEVNLNALAYILSAFIVFGAFSNPAFSQWVIKLNISPNTDFAVIPHELDFGELGSGRMYTLYVENTGNVPLNLSIASSDMSILQGAYAVASDESNEGGPSCPSEYEGALSEQFSKACDNLGFLDSADRIGISIRLAPKPNAQNGAYSTNILVKGYSSSKEKSGSLKVNFKVSPKPAAIQAPKLVDTGSQTSLEVIDESGRPIQLAVVLVTDPEGNQQQLRADKSGQANFVPSAQGDYTFSVVGRQSLNATVKSLYARPQISAQGLKTALENPSMLPSFITNAIIVAAASLLGIVISVPFIALAIAFYAFISYTKAGQNFAESVSGRFASQKRASHHEKPHSHGKALGQNHQRSATDGGHQHQSNEIKHHHKIPDDGYY